MRRAATIDCQGCGRTLRELDEREAQVVAGRPYEFVWFCAGCKTHAAPHEEGPRVARRLTGNQARGA